MDLAKGSRGPGLAAAKAAAERAAVEHGTTELWCQHSDRLARGDGKKATHLIEIVLWAGKSGVALRSVQDDHTFSDLIHAVLMGERNYEDSKRKSSASRAGKRRRFERGESTGPLHDGYRLEPRRNGDGEPEVNPRTKAIVYDRVIDPDRAPLILRIFEMVEGGHTFGDVARALNADGLKTRRGKTWTTRRVRGTVHNVYYAGRTFMNGEVRPGTHVPLIDPDRYDHIIEGLKRLDPVAARSRAGGRRPAADYLLRGIALCGRCGSTIYTRRYAAGRHYLCAAVREARGICDAPPIPADTVEAATLNHLGDFKINLAAWLAERAAAHDAQRADLQREADRLRNEAHKLDRLTDKAEDEHRRLLEQEPDLAAVALRQVARIEADRDEAHRVADAAQLRADEFMGEPSMDAALDFFNEVADVIEGKLMRAEGMRELNATLRGLLEGAWLDVDDQGRIEAQFRLRLTEAVATGDAPTELAFAMHPAYAEKPVRMGRQTERQTLVERCLVAWVEDEAVASARGSITPVGVLRV